MQVLSQFIKKVTQGILIFILTMVCTFATKVTSIFDNKKLDNEVVIKSLVVDDTIAVFTLELDEKHNVKQNNVYLAKEHNDNNYQWKKKQLSSKIGIPLIITQNKGKVVIVGDGIKMKSSSDALFTKDINDFLNEDGVLFENDNLKESLPHSKKSLPSDFNYVDYFYLNRMFGIEYFWSGESKNILNLWSHGENKLITIDTNTSKVDAHTLPIKKSSQLSFDKTISYKDGVYYLSNYYIDGKDFINKVYYSYNGSNWIERSIGNNLEKESAYGHSYQLGNDVYLTSLYPALNYGCLSNVIWKISDESSDWTTVNSNISFIQDSNPNNAPRISKSGDNYNIILKYTSSSKPGEYIQKYFRTKDFENFDHSSVKPIITEKNNDPDSIVDLYNVKENNSDNTYVEKNKLLNPSKDFKNINEAFQFDLIKVD